MAVTSRLQHVPVTSWVTACDIAMATAFVVMATSVAYLWRNILWWFRWGSTMTTTNHDDQLGEIYPVMLNELNCTVGVSFLKCLLLWSSWYRHVSRCYGYSVHCWRQLRLSVWSGRVMSPPGSCVDASHYDLPLSFIFIFFHCLISEVARSVLTYQTL